MRMLVLVTGAGLAAAAAALTASATPPGVDGVVLFSQPRCPAWAARRCDFLPQPCAVDPALDTSFVPDLLAGAVLSPDGSSVAWIADSNLVVQQGDELRRVAKVEGGIALPAWSPDGSEIAANGFTLANPAPLEAFDVATGTARTLTTGVFDPSWSPDGSEIAAAVPDGIVAVPAAGGPLRRIVTDSGTGNVGDRAPDWSPDSSSLAVTHLAGLQPSTVQLV